MRILNSVKKKPLLALYKIKISNRKVSVHYLWDTKRCSYFGRQWQFLAKQTYSYHNPTIMLRYGFIQVFSFIHNLLKFEQPRWPSAGIFRINKRVVRPWYSQWNITSGQEDMEKASVHIAKKETILNR